jgi:hypothetical protein
MFRCCALVWATVASGASTSARRDFASRDEAVAYARATIARRQATLRRQFMDVTQRALRERHGFPRELSEALAATYDDAMRALKSGRSKS